MECTTPIDFTAGGTDGIVIDNYFPDDANSTAYDETVATPAARGIGFAGNHYKE